MPANGQNFMKTENAGDERNIDIVSVCPEGILPAQPYRKRAVKGQQATCLFGAQAESLCS
jgi:hypothetical protein